MSHVERLETAGDPPQSPLKLGHELVSVRSDPALVPLDLSGAVLDDSGWIAEIETRVVQEDGHARVTVPKNAASLLAQRLANDTIWSFEPETSDGETDTVTFRIDDPNLKHITINGGGDELPSDYVLGYERRYAQVYREGGERFEMRRPNPEIAWLLENKHVTDTSKVVDLGCGEGRDTLSLGRAGVQVVGVDISPSALAKLTEDRDGEMLTNIEVLEDDLRSLGKLPDEMFDVAINMGALHMLARTQDRKDHLTQVFRILRPNGIFLVKHSREWLKGFRTVVWSKIDQSVLKPGDIIPRRIWLPDGTIKEIPMEMIPHRTAKPDDLRQEVEQSGFRFVQPVLTTEEGGFGNSYSLLFQKPYAQNSRLTA